MNLTFPAIALVSLLSANLAVAGEAVNTTKVKQDMPVAAVDVSVAASPAVKAERPAAAPVGRTRAQVHAEAVEAVKNYRTPLEESFDLSKN
ncbi:hypothetical protein ACFDR9_002554 [Janthinobacterium sp. CG_23.3]|uniref:hypothetical protein n=1 Tax=Janthinobacterium sp. CG_23.3 TaxID=3349634 RepID=UPI0038D4F982